MIEIAKIISGGQTGADRAALDWAIANGIPHGGWCPKGRLSEDGRVPDAYQLQETTRTEYLQRTEWNVRDSDATVIFTVRPELKGGSRRTGMFAEKLKKPWLHLSESEGLEWCIQRLKEFLSRHTAKVLNIAGSRGSKEPTVGAFVQAVFSSVFSVTYSPGSEGLVLPGTLPPCEEPGEYRA